MTEERLPPERRFRLYNRLAEIFREAGMTEAEAAARALSREAMRESPQIQNELGALLNAMREEMS